MKSSWHSGDASERAMRKFDQRSRPDFLHLCCKSLRAICPDNPLLPPLTISTETPGDTVRHASSSWLCQKTLFTITMRKRMRVIGKESQVSGFDTHTSRKRGQHASTDNARSAHVPDEDLLGMFQKPVAT